MSVRPGAGTSQDQGPGTNGMIETCKRIPDTPAQPPAQAPRSRSNLFNESSRDFPIPVRVNTNWCPQSRMDSFCLKWQHYESSLATAFQELRSDSELLDVTLGCEGGQLQAHQVVLSACSSFFREILRQNKHPHPFIYLRGVNFAEIVSILKFMYEGEVNVAQEKLNPFLLVAEELKVKGLSKYKSQIGVNHSDLRTNNISFLKHKITPLPQDLQLPPVKRSRASSETPVLSSSQVREEREREDTLMLLTPKPDPETRVGDQGGDQASVIIPQPSWDSQLDRDDITDQEENKITGTDSDGQLCQILLTLSLPYFTYTAA